MEKHFLEQAEKWSLQNDDEIRQHLESIKNKVLATGNRIKLQIKEVNSKLLNTDCNVQQLNTHISLLKNAKYVEQTVEDDDSRPKPSVPVQVLSKDEMVQNVVSVVRETYRCVTGHLKCERQLLSSENIPAFTSLEFKSLSLRPKTRVTNESLPYVHTELSEPPPVSSISSPSSIPSQLPPIVPDRIPISRPYDSETSDSELSSRILSTKETISHAPPPPDMSGFSPKPIRNVAAPQKSRGLFSSDDEGEEVEKESVIKPKSDLMAQLETKLKIKEQAVQKKESSMLKETLAAPMKESSQDDFPISEAGPSAVIQNGHPSPKPVPTISTPTNVEVNKPQKKDVPPLTSKSITSQSSLPVRETKKEPPKKKSLFSDSESSDDGFAPMTLPRQPFVRPTSDGRTKEQIKVDIKKTMLKKSIFDSDSDDDIGFFKKPTSEKKTTPAAVKVLPTKSETKSETPLDKSPTVESTKTETPSAIKTELSKTAVYHEGKTVSHIPEPGTKKEPTFERSREPESSNPTVVEKQKLASQAADSTNRESVRNTELFSKEPFSSLVTQIEKEESSPELPPDRVPDLPDRRSESPDDSSSSDSICREPLPPLPTEDPLTNSPLEPIMPVHGKTPGKLNNSNFAAMLGSKLSAGPPGMRPSPSSQTASSSQEVQTISSSEATRYSGDSSPTSLSHLTKSRPRRPGVHRPTLHKPLDEIINEEDLEDIINGLATMKVPSQAQFSAATAESSDNIENGERNSVTSPAVEKKAPSKSQTVSSTSSKTEPAKIASVTKTSSKAAAAPAKKGLFDFSSSDEEPSTTKITRAAVTLKTSVTATSTEKKSPILSATSSSSTPATSASTTTKTTARGAEKYKSIFNDDDDIDVSLFKKK